MAMEDVDPAVSAGLYSEVSLGVHRRRMQLYLAVACAVCIIVAAVMLFYTPRDVTVESRGLASVTLRFEPFELTALAHLDVTNDNFVEATVKTTASVYYLSEEVGGGAMDKLVVPAMSSEDAFTEISVTDSEFGEWAGEQCRRNGRFLLEWTVTCSLSYLGTNRDVYVVDSADVLCAPVDTPSPTALRPPTQSRTLPSTPTDTPTPANFTPSPIPTPTTTRTYTRTRTRTQRNETETLTPTSTPSPAPTPVPTPLNDTETATRTPSLSQSPMPSPTNATEPSRRPGRPTPADVVLLHNRRQHQPRDPDVERVRKQGAPRPGR
eukprot:TRINITY_DN6849_c0_g1_i1.p1 TRINITY_DN6849_c0_g1~~TRINITY_DN6849_c0_g1_i1.p1  ORF type:complete len:366 (+),score=45.20 TRINITY_DN6849_c0_g1_i1:133-1098(+)